MCIHLRSGEGEILFERKEESIDWKINRASPMVVLGEFGAHSEESASASESYVAVRA